MPRSRLPRSVDMELTWHGNASVVLREGESAIAFDPFCGLAVGDLKSPPERLPDQETLVAVPDVFVTHGHFDHIYHLPRLYKDTRTVIHCTAAPAKTLSRAAFPRDRLHIIEPGWSGTAGPFAIEAWQGRHCRFDAPLVRRTLFQKTVFRHPGHTLRLLFTHLADREKGETLFYQVTCGGVRVQLMGSMGLDETQDYPTGADVLVLPLQGRSDQDTYALRFVRRLAPKKVILDHFDNSFPPVTGEIDPTGFVDNVQRELGIPCVVPRRGERIALEKTEEEEEETL